LESQGLASRSTKGPTNEVQRGNKVWPFVGGGDEKRVKNEGKGWVEGKSGFGLKVRIHTGEWKTLVSRKSKRKGRRRGRLGEPSNGRREGGLRVRRLNGKYAETQRGKK